MILKNLSYFIDIKNFPINEPDSAKYKKIVKEAQEAIMLTQNLIGWHFYLK